MWLCWHTLLRGVCCQAEDYFYFFPRHGLCHRQLDQYQPPQIASKQSATTASTPALSCLLLSELSKGEWCTIADGGWWCGPSHACTGLHTALLLAAAAASCTSTISTGIVVGWVQEGLKLAVIAAAGAHVAHTVQGGPQAGIRAEALQSNLSRRAAPGAVCHTGNPSNRLCRLGAWGLSQRATLSQGAA